MSLIDQPPAGLLRRMAAGIYDLLLLAGLLMVVGFVVVVARGGQAVPAGAWWFQLLVLTVTVGFYAGFWSRGGQTLGMRSWRLQVVTTNGEPPSFGVSLLRFAGALLSIAAFGMGLLWILVDKERRGWHDLLSQTRVIVLPKKAGWFARLRS